MGADKVRRLIAVRCALFLIMIILYQIFCWLSIKTFITEQRKINLVEIFKMTLDKIPIGIKRISAYAKVTL